MSDPLTTATDAIHKMMTRRTNPLSSLEATFAVVESMDVATAKAVLNRLIAQRHLCQLDGDIAQMLDARLGVEVAWSHQPLSDFVSGSGEWVEGRGSNDNGAS